MHNRIRRKSNSNLRPLEIMMSHSSMLKARRQHQKNKKLIAGAAKLAKRMERLAKAGPAAKKEKVPKVRVKKEKVRADKVEKVKPAKEEPGRQDTKDAKKTSAGVGKKGAS